MKQRNFFRSTDSHPLREILRITTLVGLLFLSASIVSSPAEANGKVRVVTTTEDLAAIAREVGGNRVQVESLTKGYQDPHFVDPRPSYLVKLNKADLFVQVGLELEVGWAPPLLVAARNKKIVPGGPGFVEASKGIPILEVPTAASRAEGDVHPYGNPHVWLDPANGKVISRNLRDALARIRPADAAYFTERSADFERRLDASIADWKARADRLGLRGMKVVTYHRSWSYFSRAFGLEVIDFVEPRPGVPPSAGHIHELIESMKKNRVKLLIVETYFDPKLPQRIAKDSGAALEILPSSVGAEGDIDTYFELFDTQLDRIEETLGNGRS